MCFLFSYSNLQMISIFKANGSWTPEVRRSLMQGFHPTTKKAKQRKIRKALQ